MSDRAPDKAIQAEAAPASPELRRFTRAEYHAMGEAGIFGPEERVELINGRIVSMMPIGPWHCGSSNRLLRAVFKAYGETAVVTAGNPVGLGDNSEPQPDVTVLRNRDDFYSTAHPEPKDVILLIEIADSSRAFDLGTKHDLYAGHGIAEAWVVDRQSACVHVFRQPREGLFTESRVYRPGEEIPLPECEGKTLAVADTGV